MLRLPLSDRGASRTPVTSPSIPQWCRLVLPYPHRTPRALAPVAEEFVYLAVVLDAFSRRVIGWAMASHLQA
ncbi:MAG: hypothetical protein ABI369_00565, partial [Acetobacteraceae bacterium]